VTATRRAEEALRRLADAAVPVEDAGSVAARRARVVPEIAAAVRKAGAARVRGKAMVWIVGSVAAAAAVAVVGAVVGVRVGGGAGAASPATPGWLRTDRGSVVLVREGRSGEVAPAAPAPIGARDEIGTSAGAEASIDLATGVRVSVRPSSWLRIPEPGTGPAAFAGDALDLRWGTVEIRAPRLARPFAVRTPDAEVTVRGTAFTVAYGAPADGGVPVTLVAVAEGTVEARSNAESTLVGAGQTWSTGAPQEGTVPTASPSAATSVPTTTAVTSTRSPTPTAATTTATPTAPAPSSSLGEQNRLLQAAHEARRRGDERAAVRRLDDLLARFPGSPLAQEARVERFRALERLGEHEAAARDARRYLAEHRDGFARDEARRVAMPVAADAGPASPAASR
jgi:hypothetical protein